MAGLKNRINTNWWLRAPFRIIFLVVALGYIVFYTPYGLENGDMGSIFGISWSMYNGYIPHVDFYYIKPAFPPYFHSLWLYITEDYAYLINRGFYYVQVFTYALLAIKLISKHLITLPANTLYFLATLGAVITIHNYPPMPWNTIDGVFFTVLGIYILLEKNNWKAWLLASFFISLGVLSKQSFYFMPIFITAYLILNKDYKRLSYFIGFGVLFALMFLGVIATMGALSPFYEQTFSFTSGSSFVDAGIKSYLLPFKTHFFYIIGIGALIALLYYKVPKNIGFAFVSLLFAGYLTYLFFGEDSYHTVKAWIFQVLFVGAAGIALQKSFKNKNYRMLLLLLALSWCASISNGFKTPIAFAVPIVATYFLLFFGKQINTFKPITAAIILTAFIVTFGIGYQTIYNDSDRSELTYNMGDVFKRLSGIKSDEATYLQYQELKQLDEKYDNYTILPSMTLGHYVTDTKNPIGVDWVFNHHLADNLEHHLQLLENKDVIVFLEPFENHKNNYEESSLLTVYIKDNWQQIDSTSYFRIYRKQAN